MAGGTKLEPRPAQSPAQVPPQSHQRHDPPAPPPTAAQAPQPPQASQAAPPLGRTRRLFLRAAFALGMIGGTAAALTPILRADPGGADARAENAAGPPTADLFDEMYGGRHIRGTATYVRIDGRPLHLMRRADGSYVSVVNHFEAFPTPLAAARAAVDDLGGARLSLAGPALH